MADFTSYESLAKDRMRHYQPYLGMECVATEKIHGSNGLMKYSRNNEGIESVRFGKRTAWVDSNENFFNCHNVTKEHIPNLSALYNHLFGSEPNHILQVRGELCAGYMPNALKIGPLEPNTTIVQKGPCAIKYHRNLFVVFDIQYDDNWCHWDKMVELCKKFEFHHVPEVGRGNIYYLKDSINVEELVSPFSKLLHGEGEDKIKLHSKAEGVVFRVLKPKDPTKFDWRVKYKCEDMLERAPKKDRPKIASECQRFQEICVEYINDNRWDTFLSKHGPDNFIDQNIGKNIGMLVTDAINDIKEDHPAKYEEYGRKVRGAMTKRSRNYILNYMKTL